MTLWAVAGPVASLSVAVGPLLSSLSVSVAVVLAMDALETRSAVFRHCVGASSSEQHALSLVCPSMVHCWQITEAQEAFPGGQVCIKSLHWTNLEL